MTSSATRLEVRRLGKSLGGRPVLRDLDFRASLGVTALLGRNGAGKSTLLRVLCGALTPRSGKVLRDGKDVYADRGAMVRHRASLGWLPQEPGYPPRMSVEDFLGYAAWLKRVPRREVGKAATLALQRVDLLALRSDRLGTLSGGQRRRASLAASLVGSPDLVLLDEPTNGLDPVQREQFLAVVRDLGDTTCVVLATHLLEDVGLCADRWVAMSEGSVRHQGEVSRRSASELTGTLASIRGVMGEGTHDLSR